MIFMTLVTAAVLYAKSQDPSVSVNAWGTNRFSYLRSLPSTDTARRRDRIYDLRCMSAGRHFATTAQHLCVYAVLPYMRLKTDS